MPPATPSQSLRTLGQEFEKHQVLDFDVSFESEGCHVRATVPPKPVEPPPQPARKWSLKEIFKPAHQQVEAPVASAEPETWEHSFTWSELEHLEEEHRTQRHAMGGAPDDYSTSQMLRVIGAYAERQHWALAGVARNHQIIEIRHRRPDGRLEAVSQKFADLYDFAVRLSKLRGVETGELR